LAERCLFLLLGACAILYRGVVCCRQLAYHAGILRIYRAGLPVVSVGNLAVGGTGKTPVVDRLLRWSTENAVRAAVVSRGYGGTPGNEALLISDGQELLIDNAALCGDEPLLLARRNPAALVIVARRRAAGVRLAEQLGAQLVILDDGFQHLSVARDLDIVLLDSRRPFGNRRLLPAGILREPPSHLARADIVILTRSDRGAATLPEFPGLLLRAQHRLADVARDLAGTGVRLEELVGRPCVLFAGIADPAAFFEALRQLGVTPLAELAMADHQEYAPTIYRQIEAAAGNAEFYLTTEKDAVKLTAAQLSRPCYVVPLEIDIEPPAPLDQRLHTLLSRSHSS
jgi:tetraacyldisaccharide 4'-kinase